MAVLVDADRINALADFIRGESSDSQAVAAIRADLRAAVNAVDDWVVANQTSYNSALPLPARTALTTRQKTRLLMYVLERRYLTGV